MPSGKFAVSFGFGGRTSPNAPNTSFVMGMGVRVGDGSTGGAPPVPPEPAAPLLPPEAPPAPAPLDPLAPPEPAPPEPPAPPPPPPPEQTFAAVDELRGSTVPTLKSAALLSESVQPAPARDAEVVLLSVAVGPLPSKPLADEP